MVRIADLAELTAKHPLVQQAINRIGTHAAELRDQLLYTVLDAATTIYRPNSRANDNALLPTDFIGYNDLNYISSTLANNGAMEFGDGNFAAVQSPFVYAAVLRDPDYKASNQFKAPEKIWKGQVDSLCQFSIVRTNSGAFAATAGSGSSKVYTSFYMGKEAYQVSDLQNLEVKVVPAGNDHSDPLAQYTLIGYKFAFKGVISNQDWIVRGRSSGINAV